MTPGRRLPFAPAALLAAAMGAALAFAAGGLHAQQPQVSTAAPVPPIAATRAPARIAAAAVPKAEAKPTWAELTEPQRAALAPLSASWSGLSEAHKRKWLVVSTNFPTMPPGEQARVHSRMAEWAALSPQQRNRARMNFAESQKVPTSDKKAKWEAYQDLPPEEKRKLAGAAAATKPVPPPTAAAVQPTSPKLVVQPPKRAASSPGARIAVLPEKIDQNTLLPQPVARPASSP